MGGDDKSRLGYCTNRNFNSLPFSSLNEDDFDNTYTLRFNLKENLQTKLQNSKFNPFSLNQDNHIRADINNIDPDSSELLRRINEDNLDCEQSYFFPHGSRAPSDNKIAQTRKVNEEGTI